MQNVTYQKLFLEERKKKIIILFDKLIKKEEQT